MSIAVDKERIDRSLVSGVAWTAVLRWTAQFISWAGTLYAARVLSPADFGLVAMAMLAIGLARMVQEFGLDAILVQDRGIVGDAQARLAGLMVALGLGLATLYLVMSPLIAAFFQEPRVSPMVATLGLLFVLDSIQIVPYAQMQRELQFRRLAFVSLIQSTAMAATLVTTVSLGFGAWSLVANHVIGEIAVTIALLAWSPYSIAWPRDLAVLARPLLQGWRVLVSRIFWYAQTNADQAIIGRLLGKDLLGAYSIALTFSTLAQKEIGSVVSRVVPGVFSEVQDHRAELRRYFLLLTEFLTILSFPVAVGFALVADLIVPLILGEQWHAVIAPVRWLCLYSCFLSSQAMISHVLLWTGQFRVAMWCSIFASVTMPLALLFSVRFGLEGVGVAWAFVAPVVSVPIFVFAFRTLGIGLRLWLEALRPAGAGCLMMATAVLAARAAMPDSLPAVVQAAIAILTGAAAYPACIWLLFRSRVELLRDLARSVRRRPALGPV